MEVGLMPHADYCVGREDLCQNIATKSLRSGFCLFFGGRKSGKRTVLKWLTEKWSTPGSAADKAGVMQLATLIDLSEVQKFTSDEQFFRSALDAFREVVSRRISGFELPDLHPLGPRQTGADWFFYEVDRVIKCAPRLTFKIIFLIHRTELLFDWGFEDQLFRNLLTNVRNHPRPSNGRVGMVLSGGRKLYDLAFDVSSPIASIADREFAYNLQPEAITGILQLSGCDVPGKAMENVSKFVQEATGGQPYLVRCLCQTLACCASRDFSDGALKRHAKTIAEDQREQFRIWISDFGNATNGALARITFDVLLTEKAPSHAVIEDALRNHNLDPGLVERSARQCAFSGIAKYDPGSGLERCNKMFWEYAEQVVKVVRTQPSSPVLKPTSISRTQNSFCRTGAGWDIHYENRTCFVVNSDGFAYIGKLLQAQPSPVTLNDLRNEVGKSDISSLSLPDDMADQATLLAIKREMTVLKDAIETANATQNVARAAECHIKLINLASQYERLTYRGRSKKIGNLDKAVANAVGNAISKAIKLLRSDQYHPELAKHLHSQIISPYSPSPRYAPSPQVQWKIVL